jgi:4-amino-4-deoxy-L-arabinose transferase-like glycosyltransferase
MDRFGEQYLGDMPRLPDNVHGAADAQRLAWLAVLVPALAQPVLHLLTGDGFGIFRDEYYYLACAARPAWGYVDHPSLSIWLLAAWTTVFGDSVRSIRVPPALCGSALVVLAGATTAELGGRRWAQLFTGLGVAVGLAGLVIAGFYSMNSYDLLVWAGAYYLVIRIARTGEGRLWPWLGLVLGLGLLNKIGVLVLGLALAIALLATEHRRHFRDPRLYLGGLIAGLFLVPYVLWNLAHGWPTLQFIANAQRYKIANLSLAAFVSENVLEANPLALPLWLGGLVWLLVARPARPYRLAGVMFLLTFLILVVQKSKPYYFAASFPPMMAAGGVAWERWTSGRRWRWARGLMAANLLAAGLVFAPAAVPLLSPEGTVAYLHRLGIAPVAQEVGRTSVLPQYFSDRLGWEELARVVSDAYRRLPEDDRKRSVVLGRNYGHAGALEYWSRRYAMPRVYSVHNNYWLWGPPAERPEVVIVTGGRRAPLEELCGQVVAAGEAVTPLAMESRIPVWLCRGLRQPLAEVWAEYKAFN